MEAVAGMMRSQTYRRGAPDDPARLWALLRSIAGQLGIDWETGLISPTAAGTIYVPVSQKGRVRLATASPYRVPIDCTLTTVWVNLGTTSSSGSVTLRLNIGANDYDTSVTSGNTTGSATHSVSLTAGDVITAEVTAVGTGAENLGAVFALVP